MAKKRKPMRARSGPPPDQLRKSGPMRDRTKYQRTQKHKNQEK